MQPKQTWTLILKVTLVLSLIGGFIGFLIYAIVLKTWWIAPVGWIGTFLSVSSIGTLAEVSENLAEHMRAEHYPGYGGSVPDYEPVSMKINDDPCSISDCSFDSRENASYTENTAPSAADRAASQAACEGKENWICPECGEPNSLDTIICARCGKQVWICPKCGEGNSFDIAKCPKCGWEA